ncbi:MAG: hypothetical protein L6V93_21725 [Clostridiales bacterium]|nr:MAG: hypothetical protein L6V93_21725 [Clostridiales bacterium]
MKTALKKHMSLMVYANGVGPINRAKKTAVLPRKIFRQGGYYHPARGGFAQTS